MPEQKAKTKRQPAGLPPEGQVYMAATLRLAARHTEGSASEARYMLMWAADEFACGCPSKSR